MTRALRVTDEIVDQNSPGFHGRFTAKSALTAYFGVFPADTATTPETPERTGRIEGTITEFKDGGTDLGFEVTLGLNLIGNGEFMDADATATFGKTNDATGTGTWSAQTYGINDTDKVESTFPSGIAGEFDVRSTYTKIVGAFAAKRK